jgi:hypothetical protein
MHLPEEQQAQIMSWLAGGLSLDAVTAKIASEFNVQVSAAVVSSYYHERVMPLVQERRDRAALLSVQLGGAAERNPGRFDAAIVDALRTRSLELALNEKSDLRELRDTFGLVLKHSEVRLEERKVRLLEQRAKADKPASTKPSTAAEQQKMVREIFGLPPDKPPKPTFLPS